ncbi:MAG TPA: hypothetical protein VN796_08620 [Acidimicrobiales bacterium]|nr:hypothetical protein [Acidimicrobiales bacterium]
MLTEGNADDGRPDVRVVERQADREDDHFTEGELDLEAPEELAVLEVDEEAILEEDLENEVDHEDEVDEDVLENSLDHLVHDGDEDVDGGIDVALAAVATEAVVAGGAVEAGDAVEADDLEIEDLEDREESLDRILREKLAGDEEPGEEFDDLVTGGAAGTDGIGVPACGADEFVCRSCFLVRHEAQRAGVSDSLCLDCRG